MKTRFIGLYFLVAMCLLCTSMARGQTATAEIAGRITDPAGAVVPQADVEVVNIETGVKRAVQSDAGGRYVVPLLEPGLYRMTVTKTGFSLIELPSIRLTVNQSVTQDVTLSLGAVTQHVEVKAESDLIQTATSEIGTVVGQKPTNELPLNGRNFSQLLTMVPGLTPVSTSQNNTLAPNSGAHPVGVPTATFSLPSIAGQWNRSIFFMMDGVNDTEMNSSVYVIPPSVDTVQEFKVQFHNDKAEYGGVLGGVISVITKSGTNNLHGSAYEFVRNNWFDARNPFTDEFRNEPSPFRQNQFGVTVGGPVMIPKLYNGRNRTFFYFGYEGWRYSQAAQSRYYVPTAAELSGDFSHSLIGQNIYDPATTRVDPGNPSLYIRDQFAGNVIPDGRIDPKVVSFTNTYFDRPNLVGDPVHNAMVTFPKRNNANQYNIRGDEQLGSKDNMFFRWSGVNTMATTPVTLLENQAEGIKGRAIAAGWNHLFSPALILEVRGGYTRRPFSVYTSNSAGIAPMLGLGFTTAGGSVISLASPWSEVGVSPLQHGGSPTRHISGNLILVHGQHNIKVGVQYLHQSNDTTRVNAGATYTFSNDTTGDPQLVGSTGASLASALLGLPSQTDVTAGYHYANSYVTWSAFAQDQWKLTNNVTLTYGLRFDRRGPFSQSGAGAFASGATADGDYWIGMDKMPGLCSVVGAAPCLPAALSDIPNSDHIKLSPYGTAWGPKTEWDDWGPRVGIAWRLDEKMVVRGGYGIVYDPLMGLGQDWKGIVGEWPGASGIVNPHAYNQLGQALTPLEDTLGNSASVLLPAADPWSQTNWFFDPYHKDARSQQWNVEVERQMASNLALSVGYVGSYSDRLDMTGLWNTATTPGAGTVDQVNARRPYPWWNGANFMGTSRGNASYHGLEVKLEHRFDKGLYYLVSYTWSKSMDIGSSGWFAAENGSGGGQLQNYYDPNGSRSVSSYDIPHFLSMSGIYELPFGRGKKYFNQHGAASWLLGNWQVNGMAALRSGQPFTVYVSGDVANIGNTVSWWSYARPNLVGNPSVANRTSEEWFNPSAFAVPSFSYGNVGRNTLRSAPVYTADFSLFKNFPVREGMNLSFRAEFFNVFNIQNLSTPDSLIGDAAVGRITSTVNDARQIQLALRLTF